MRFRKGESVKIKSCTTFFKRASNLTKKQLKGKIGVIMSVDYDRAITNEPTALVKVKGFNAIRFSTKDLRHM